MSVALDNRVRELEKGLAELQTELAALKAKVEDPKPDDPIVAPSFPRALRDIGFSPPLETP